MGRNVSDRIFCPVCPDRPVLEPNQSGELICPSCSLSVRRVPSGPPSGGPGEVLDPGAREEGANTVADPQPPPFSPELLGQYRFIRVLGRGGMGTVYLMNQVRLERFVAVKVLKSDEVTVDQIGRLLKEAKILAGLSDAHILTVFDAGLDGQTPYVVCEYVEGTTLGARLQGDPPLSLHQALDLTIRILGGLEAAHDRGIVHRDLKPDNIFLTLKGTPKIGDFGLAKAQALPSGTSVGKIMGTPRYMSPEQCRGRGSTPASDLYAMGVMLFEMATGRAPFAGPTLAEYLYQHAAVPPPPARSLVPECPPRLDEILTRALAKEPEERFQTATEFRKAASDLYRSLEPMATDPLADLVRPPGAAAVPTPTQVGRPRATDPDRTPRPISGPAREPGDPPRPRPWTLEAYCFYMIAPGLITLLREGYADARLYGYMSQGFQYRFAITMVLASSVYLVWMGRVRKLLVGLHLIGIVTIVASMWWGSSLLGGLLQLLYAVPGVWLLTHRATVTYCERRRAPLCDPNEYVDRFKALKTAGLLTLVFVGILIGCGLWRSELAEPAEDDTHTVSICPAKGWSRLATDGDCLMSFQYLCKEGATVQLHRPGSSSGSRRHTVSVSSVEKVLYRFDVRCLGRTPTALTESFVESTMAGLCRRYRGFVPVRKVFATNGGQRWFECFGTFASDPVHRGLFVFLTVAQGYCFELACAGERINMELDQDLLRSVVGTFRLIDLPSKLSTAPVMESLAPAFRVIRSTTSTRVFTLTGKAIAPGPQGPGR